jgi:probable HAF family extracellular repeat protein
MPAGTLGSRAVDVTNTGAVAGDYGTISGGGAFLKDGDTFWALGTLPGGNTSHAFAVNDANVVVGAWGNSVTGPFPLAFRWENGVMEDISGDLPLEGLSEALDISENGLITGWSGPVETYPTDSHAFIWGNGKAVDLGLLADAVATEGLAINNDGNVCGIWFRLINAPPLFERRGFLWDGKEMIDLGLLEGHPELNELVVFDINESDQIACAAGSNGVPERACLWSGGQLYDLNDLVLPTPDLDRIRAATAINESGQIAGRALVVVNLQQRIAGVLLTPVPPRIGDTNCDAVVNVDDLLTVIKEWGAAPAGSAGDLNVDGVVNMQDMQIVLSNWS